MSVARCATGRYSSHASLIFLLVSLALASFSATSCAVCFVIASTSMSSVSSSRLPCELESRKSRSSSSCLIFFLYDCTSSISCCRCSSSSCFSLRMSLPSSWSSRPAIVTVKSTTVTLAESSGVKCGLGRRVVQNRRNVSVKSTSLSARGTTNCLPFLIKRRSSTGSSTGSSSSSMFSISSGLPNARQSSRLLRNMRSFSCVTLSWLASSRFMIQMRPWPWGSTSTG
mmetsp:Transcript_5849/g.17923  ORF Transcript_5849/g.17923 Transcript_5849/m.17923 type:complete len:227 (+) Transcript_5849:2608-3288(+)